MENSSLFTGIQQVGIGVPDAQESFNWYNANIGLNVPIFDDVARAELMTPHTNGIIRERRAILALNMAGGGGAEIWQSIDPAPIPKSFEPKIGDLGIVAIKIKASDVRKVSNKFNSKEHITPEGKPTTWSKDNNNNLIQFVEDSSWFQEPENFTGGVLGVVIGVSNIEKSLTLYRDILGISEVVYDQTKKFIDLEDLGGGDREVRRILLRKKQNQNGAFTRLFGNIEIELIQYTDMVGRKIFDGRSWGDLGYIHVCFDTLDMDQLKIRSVEKGYDFSVDSGQTFGMGEAGGRFAYIEDPDGTLLEFVETHKVPMLKQIGWYKTLKKGVNQKPLPNWMIKTIGWSKVKPK